jgi:hypothetical protein
MSGLPSLHDGALERTSPPWLRRKIGLRLLRTLETRMSVSADRRFQGVRARYPDKAPDDALAYIGADRGIERGFAEPAAGYATRLLGWLDAWKIAGSPRGLMLQLAGYLSGYAVNLRVVSNSSAWDTLDESGVYTHVKNTTWNWDGDSTSWWRFWVIIYPDPAIWVEEGAWGSGGAWGDGGVWGVDGATPEQGAALKRLIQIWKAAHAAPQWLIVSFSWADWDPAGITGSPLPAGEYGRWSKDDGSGNRVKARNETSRYAYLGS